MVIIMSATDRARFIRAAEIERASMDEAFLPSGGFGGAVHNVLRGCPVEGPWALRALMPGLCDGVEVYGVRRASPELLVARGGVWLVDSQLMTPFVLHYEAYDTPQVVSVSLYFGRRDLVVPDSTLWKWFCLGQFPVIEGSSAFLFVSGTEVG